MIDNATQVMAISQTEDFRLTQLQEIPDPATADPYHDIDTALGERDAEAAEEENFRFCTQTMDRLMAFVHGPGYAIKGNRHAAAFTRFLALSWALGHFEGRSIRSVASEFSITPQAISKSLVKLEQRIGGGMKFRTQKSDRARQSYARSAAAVHERKRSGWQPEPEPGVLVWKAVERGTGRPMGCKRADDPDVRAWQSAMRRAGAKVQQVRAVS